MHTITIIKSLRKYEELRKRKKKPWNRTYITSYNCADTGQHKQDVEDITNERTKFTVTKCHPEHIKLQKT